MKEERARRALEAEHCSLYAELYQRAASMGVLSVDNLCRKAHVIELKLCAVKGRKNDNP